MKLDGFFGRFRHELLAMAGGLLWAVSFPKIGWAPGAWLASGVILLAALKSGRPFRIGYAAGAVHYLASLYWLLLIPFPSGAISGWLALSAYLSIYPAAWAWICCACAPRSARSGELDGAAGIGWAFFCAVAWVALEMMITRVLSGFPWNLLGASQYAILPLIQIASITGIYGVSFILVWFSTGLAISGLALARAPARRNLALAPAAVPLIAVILLTGLGMRAILRKPAAGRTLKAALVQPSIPQNLIFDPRENDNRFKQLIELSRRALATKPDLLVWPEAALPTMLRYNEEEAKQVLALARDAHVWVVVGSDDAVPKGPNPSTAPSDYNFYNSSFLINPEGELASVYRKRRLVIFGEYVPLSSWFPFLKHLTPVGENGFTPGQGPSVFDLGSLHARVSTLICFEDVFPDFAREYVNEDTDFLLNLTNNGWFGESAAQWQHAASAVFRAVENRIPLVRCANNGLTCWVDSFGGLHEVYFPNTKDIYGAGFKTAEVPLMSPGERREKTFYGKHGDWFGWACVIGTLAAAGKKLSSRRRA